MTDTPTPTPDDTPDAATPDINPDVVAQGGPDADATTDPGAALVLTETERWNILVTRLGYGDLLIPTDQ